jgi:soluble lytic murein transglycosylase
MTYRKIIYLAAWGLGTLIFSGVASGPLYADIYRYVDKNGALCFTDEPREGYHLYMGSAKASSAYAAQTDYDVWIQEAARKYNVAVGLIKAMIRVESSFNHRAVSRAGAKGLMQVMPDNFAELGIRDPFDPYQNIMGGVRYLRKMLNQYNGDLQLALAAYNAGPNAVDQYGRRIPPYAETVDYVRKVMKYYIVYK